MVSDMSPEQFQNWLKKSMAGTAYADLQPDKPLIIQDEVRAKKSLENNYYGYLKTIDLAVDSDENKININAPPLDDSVNQILQEFPFDKYSQGDNSADLKARIGDLIKLARAPLITDVFSGKERNHRDKFIQELMQKDPEALAYYQTNILKRAYGTEISVIVQILHKYNIIPEELAKRCEKLRLEVESTEDNPQQTSNVKSKYDRDPLDEKIKTAEKYRKIAQDTLKEMIISPPHKT